MATPMLAYVRTVIHTAWVVAALLGASAPAGAAAEFTIEQVMQAPYPAGLTAAPVGKAAAWVFITKGVRNVWIADGANGMKARQLTTFTQDDGFDIGDSTSPHLDATQGFRI